MAEISQAEQAVAAKEKGNVHFKNNKYQLAIREYSNAILLDDTVVSFWTNRAWAYAKADFPQAALDDANRAIKLDPKFIKGYHRRAQANVLLGGSAKIPFWKAAVRDFKYVAAARPNDKKAQKEAKEAEKRFNQMKFEKAIAVQEKQAECITKILGDRIKMMKVEATYDGPVLEGNITAKFIEEMIASFKNQKKIHRKYALVILLQMAELLKTSGNLPDIPIEEGGQITVCGDTHGQYYDLLNIFELNGMPSEKNPYLFNGDFVDRGSFSVELVLTLFGLHVLYPNHFHMSRGNHETINMNKMYGFEGEVKAKFEAKFCDYFTDVYNLLPLGHIIHHKVMVVHGGLFSEDGVTLKDIRAVDRKMQPPDKGIMCEMLWSDPQHQPGRSMSKRGVGCQFGPDVTKAFLENNGLELLVRSHEVKDGGYEVMHDGKCITVFSAPNYCDQMGNKGAFITFKEDCKPNFTTFDAVPHPDVKCMAYAGGGMGMFGM